jgi:hypothetical protein
MNVKMIFAAGKRCRDPHRGGRFVRHHIPYVSNISLSLSLFDSNNEQLEVRPSVRSLSSAFRVYCVSTAVVTKKKRACGCSNAFYLKSFKRIDFVFGQLKAKEKILSISFFSALCCALRVLGNERSDERLARTLSLFSSLAISSLLLCAFVRVRVQRER